MLPTIAAPLAYQNVPRDPTPKHTIIEARTMSLCKKQDGSMCHACCTVVSLYRWYSHAEIKKHRRAFNKRAKLTIELGMLRPIPRRIAKKRNRFLFDKLKANPEFNRYKFFKCIHLKDGKCANYENRPYMCRGYPFYGQTHEEWLVSNNFKLGAQYDKECGYYDADRVIQLFDLSDEEAAARTKQIIDHIKPHLEGMKNNV